MLSYVQFLMYHIAGNFDGFDAFQPDRQNLTRQILKAIQCRFGTIRQNIFCQIFEKSASVKISCYTVLQRQLATNSRLFSISKSATYESTNPAYFLLTSAGYLLTKIAQNHGIYKPLLNYIRNTMRLGYEVWLA